MEDIARIKGISHVSLSVSDLHRSLEFYQDVMRLHLLASPTRGTAFEGDGALLLVGDRTALSLQCHDQQEPGAFNPARHGLDHLAFHVSNREALEEWETWLDESSCSHSGIIEMPGSGSMIELRDPDGIQLEIYTTK